MLEESAAVERPKVTSEIFTANLLLEKDDWVNQTTQLVLEDSFGTLSMILISCTPVAQQIALAKLSRLNVVSGVSGTEVVEVRMLSSDYEVENVDLWKRKPPPRPPDAFCSLVTSNKLQPSLMSDHDIQIPWAVNTILSASKLCGIELNKIAYNAATNNFLRVGEYDNNFGLYRDMGAKRIKSASVTFYVLLSGCCKYKKMQLNLAELDESSYSFPLVYDPATFLAYWGKKHQTTCIVQLSYVAGKFLSSLVWDSINRKVKENEAASLEKDDVIGSKMVVIEGEDFYSAISRSKFEEPYQIETWAILVQIEKLSKVGPKVVAVMPIASVAVVAGKSIAAIFVGTSENFAAYPEAEIIHKQVKDVAEKLVRGKTIILIFDPGGDFLGTPFLGYSWKCTKGSLEVFVNQPVLVRMWLPQSLMHFVLEFPSSTPLAFKSLFLNLEDKVFRWGKECYDAPTSQVEGVG